MHLGSRNTIFLFLFLLLFCLIYNNNNKNNNIYIIIILVFPKCQYVAQSCIIYSEELYKSQLQLSFYIILFFQETCTRKVTASFSRVGILRNAIKNALAAPFSIDNLYEPHLLATFLIDNLYGALISTIKTQMQAPHFEPSRIPPFKPTHLPPVIQIILTPTLKSQFKQHSTLFFLTP